MFKNQSLQARLLTAFMFMGLLVFIMALAGWTATARLSTHIDTLGNNSLPSVIGLWKVNEGQTQIEASERALLDISLSQTSRQTEITRIENAWKQIDEGFAQYTATPRSPEEEKAYQQLKVDWDVWKEDHKAFLKLNEAFEATGILNPYERLSASRGNAVETAAVNRSIQLLNQLQGRAKDNHVSFEKATNSVLAVLKINEDTASKAEKTANEDVSRITFWIVVGMIIGPATAIIFGIYFSNTIAKPMGAKIARVVDVAQKISSGDLTTQVQLSEQQDEIGKLLNAFHTMNKDLNTLIHRVQQSGIQITTSATQIAASGKELEATVAEQIASTNEVSATSQEIAATSRELVRTMEQVASMAQNTAMAAGSSQSDLIRMETVMRQLAEATLSISTRLGVMNEKANNINNVVTTITKVADQTNLLSLNAAIEAEKAGEYGAGFAVVAREIRRLADQTAVATLEIEQMVKEMQTAVSGGVMEMDKFNKSVVDTVDDVGKISTQIAQVIDQVQGLTPRFAQVSQSMEEQSQGAQQISEAMQQLTEASQQTGDALRETNSALEQLDDAAQGLQSEISRFRVA